MTTSFRGQAALIAAVAAFAAAFTAAGQTPQRTVRDGIFSAAQVERGRGVFESVCIDCHEIEEFTAANAYLDQQEGETLWSVFDYVWSEMPEDDPSQLDPEEYAAVLAYIFSVYGLPAGEADMPTTRAELRQIRIARPSLPGS